MILKQMQKNLMWYVYRRGFNHDLTFLFFFLFFLCAGPQQSEDDSSLRVDTNSSYHHAPWTLHHMGPWKEDINSVKR